MTYRSDFDALASRVDQITVGDAVDGALVERHDVTGECAGFVAEHVLHLKHAVVHCYFSDFCRA